MVVGLETPPPRDNQWHRIGMALIPVGVFALYVFGPLVLVQFGWIGIAAAAALLLLLVADFVEEVGRFVGIADVVHTTVEQMTAFIPWDLVQRMAMGAVHLLVIGAAGAVLIFLSNALER